MVMRVTTPSTSWALGADGWRWQRGCSPSAGGSLIGSSGEGGEYLLCDSNVQSNPPPGVIPDGTGTRHSEAKLDLIMLIGWMTSAVLVSDVVVRRDRNLQKSTIRYR